MFTQTLTSDLDGAWVSKRQEDNHPLHQTLVVGDLWSGPSWGRRCGMCGGGSLWRLVYRGVRWRIVWWIERVVIGIRVIATNPVTVRGGGGLWSHWFLRFLRNSFKSSRCLGHWCCSGCRIVRYLQIILRVIGTLWRFGWLSSWRNSSEELLLRLGPRRTARSGLSGTGRLWTRRVHLGKLGVLESRIRVMGIFRKLSNLPLSWRLRRGRRRGSGCRTNRVWNLGKLRVTRSRRKGEVGKLTIDWTGEDVFLII